MQIKVNYVVKWRLKTNHNYVWTTCKRLINLKTGREIRRTIKGLTAGYWVGKNFIKFDILRTQIELIPKEKLPF